MALKAVVPIDASGERGVPHIMDDQVLDPHQWARDHAAELVELGYVKAVVVDYIDILKAADRAYRLWSQADEERFKEETR